MDKKYVLSVDDSAVMRKVIKKALATINVEQLEAADGSEALGVLTKHHESIKLILLDWNMPVMDGMELLQIVKNDVIYKHIPVVMVTTESERENVLKALQSGAASYLLKPFNNDELVKKIKLHMRRD